MSALITFRLAPAVAHEAMVTVKRYSAGEALAAGIVTELATDEAVLDGAITRAHALEVKPRHAIASIRHGLHGNTSTYCLEQQMADTSTPRGRGKQSIISFQSPGPNGADVSEAREMVQRLLQSTNDHDLEALVACFAGNYENETPAHPARGFQGSAQVRRNWEQIFAFVPDLRAEVTRAAVDGDVIWTEWEMTGTQRDGSAHCMRGVVIFGVEGGVARWARFYLEPVDLSAGTVTDAVREHVVR